MPVRGKTVIITGASRGIGAAAADVFAGAGARVALLARSAGEVEALASRIGPAALALACDVSRWDEVAAAVAAAEAAFGPAEVMINNAGVIGPLEPLATSDPVAWGRTVEINLTGTYHGIRAVLPGMIARERGTILNVSSGAAHRPVAPWSAYCASKAGAAMLTRSADQEARAAGVRVMGLSPGTVATDMQRAIRASGLGEVARIDWSEHIPADWPARALLWMCGPGADPYLGQEISLRDDGIRRQAGLVS